MRYYYDNVFLTALSDINKQLKKNAVIVLKQVVILQKLDLL